MTMHAMVTSSSALWPSRLNWIICSVEGTFVRGPSNIAVNDVVFLTICNTVVRTKARDSGRPKPVLVCYLNETSFGGLVATAGADQQPELHVRLIENRVRNQRSQVPRATDQ